MQARNPNITLKKYLFIGIAICVGLYFSFFQIKEYYIKQINQTVERKISNYQSKNDSLLLVLKFSQDSLKYYKDTLVKVDILIKKLETNKFTTDETKITNRNLAHSDSTAVGIFSKRYGKHEIRTSSTRNHKANKR